MLNDLQVYCHMNVGSEQAMLQRFSECADSVSRWMSSNRLKLNPSKTELIWFYRLVVGNSVLLRDDIVATIGNRSLLTVHVVYG